MATRFCGWPQQAYAVLLELDGDPSHQTRERVRRHREEHVRQPMIDLLSDLADTDPWYEDFSCASGRPGVTPGPSRSPGSVRRSPLGWLAAAAPAG